MVGLAKMPPDQSVETKYWQWTYFFSRYMITLEPFGA
jgi:hypothetical protein